MPLVVLKTLRFIIPGILAYIFAAYLGGTTGLWNMGLPDLEKANYTPSLILPGLLYYITPLRRWVNKPHHDRLVEYIRAELVKASDVEDRPEKYSWRALKPLFFDLIDNDESLKNKSKLAYFNGAVWTTCADATSLGLIYLITAVMFRFIFEIDGSLFTAFTFLIVVILGFIGSLVTTRIQKNIAAEQIDVIKYKYRSNLENRIVDLDK